MAKTPRRAHTTLLYPAKKLPCLVEHCLALSIRQTVGNSPLYKRSTRQFLLSRPRTEFRDPMSIVAEVDLVKPANPFLRLKYELEGVAIDQCVELTSSEAPFRWWFLCPERHVRVAKLYLPPGSRRFASRIAHGLIYKCQLRPKRNIGLRPSAIRLRRRRRSSS
jgi:hypothetical protein